VRVFGIHVRSRLKCRVSVNLHLELKVSRVNFLSANSTMQAKEVSSLGEIISLICVWEKIVCIITSYFDFVLQEL
jgi:hypothetical protein